jgi:DNA-binding response OmpR family regulator
MPILLFSARNHSYTPSNQTLTCADDYVVRTDFGSIAERIRTLVRREPSIGSELLDSYEGRHLNANFRRVHVTVDGCLVDLTLRELRLLQFLVTYRNHVISRNDVLIHVWRGDNDGRSRTIDAHICRLRHKLGRAGEQIQTLVGVGYRFNEATDPD